MPAEFVMHTPEMGPNKGKAVEHFRYSMHDGPDVVFRVATDEDRRAHFKAYAAFKGKSAQAPAVAEELSVTKEVAVVVPPEAMPDAIKTPIETPKAKKKLFGKDK
jgi:hypothetical protein